MARAQRAGDASVEDMMASIGRAIHAGTRSEVTAPAESPGTDGGSNMRGDDSKEYSSVSGAMREMRVSLQPGTRVGARGSSAGSDDFTDMRDRLRGKKAGGGSSFAGIMGGEVRLEEALARLGKVGDTSSRRHVHPEEPDLPDLPDPEPEGAGPERTEPDFRDSLHDEFQPEDGQPVNPDEPDFAQPDPALDTEGRAEDSHYDYGEVDSEAPYEDPQHAYAEADPNSAHTDHIAGDEHAAYQEYHSWSTDEPAPDPLLSYPEQQPAGDYPAAPAATYPPEASYGVPMMSPDTSDTAAAAFNRLADTIVDRATSGDRSIEEVTRDLLRPMLKSWLDEHLPSIVERMVRDEIERVARRGGR